MYHLIKIETLLEDIKLKYPQALYSKAFAGIMVNTLTMSIQIDDVNIDLFLPTSQEESDANTIIDIDGIKYHHWKDIF